MAAFHSSLSDNMVLFISWPSYMLCVYNDLDPDDINLGHGQDTHLGRRQQFI